MAQQAEGRCHDSWSLPWGGGCPSQSTPEHPDQISPLGSEADRPLALLPLVITNVGSGQARLGLLCLDLVCESG